MNGPLIEHDFYQQDDDFQLGEFDEFDFSYGVDYDIGDVVEDAGIWDASSEEYGPPVTPTPPASTFIPLQPYPTGGLNYYQILPCTITFNGGGAYSFAGFNSSLAAGINDVYIEVTLNPGGGVDPTGIASATAYESPQGTLPTSDLNKVYIWIGTADNTAFVIDEMSSGMFPTTIDLIFQTGMATPLYVDLATTF